MSRLIILAASALALASVPGASKAQSITGNWIDQQGETIQIKDRNSRYVGAFASGPNTGSRVLQLVANGDGSYSGKKTRPGANQSPSDVRVSFSAGGTSLNIVCNFTRRPRFVCNETWRRPVPHYRELPADVRDKIRKPAPPPVVHQRPDLKILRNPG